MFSRTSTKQIKGWAILFMLAHHLYTFTDRIPYGMELATNKYILGVELTQFIGKTGILCVPMFMFLGGYGLFASVNIGEKSLVGNFAARLVKLYKQYWKVLFIFLPIGFIFFGNQPQYCDNEFCNLFSKFETHNFIQTLVGYRAYYNREWWFLKAYIIAIFEGLVFIRLFKNNDNIYGELFALIIWAVLTETVSTLLTETETFARLASNEWYSNFFMLKDKYTVCFLEGIVFSKYGIFMSWHSMTDKLGKPEKLIIFVAATLCSAYMRMLVNSNVDMILVPIIIFSLWVITEQLGMLQKAMTFLGKNSTNMWLTHSFFCYYFYPFVKLVYGSKNAVVAYLVLLALSIAASLLVEFIWKYISAGYMWIRGKVIKVEC